MSDERSIGVFDSGVGGISVLRYLTAELPSERFVYFGDSAHAPYGNRAPADIMALSEAIVSHFIGQDVKAIVVACNTATSVAAASLRAAHPSLPIIGVEPALKPAVEAVPCGRILVMATPVTLSLEKYRRLTKRLGGAAEIIPLACDGLAARIERGSLDAPDVRELVEHLVGNYRDQVDAVVLGCTHYPFVSATIREALGGIPLFDGGAGTAKQLRRRLAEEHLLASPDSVGSVTFESSKRAHGELALYQWFYQLPLPT